MPASAGIFYWPTHPFHFKSSPMFQRLLALLALSLMALTPAWAQDPQMNLQRVRLTAGMYQIDAQVALQPREREIGLMFRKEMPQQEGMLFVFEEPSTQCF